MRNPCHRREKGFTLVEIMVAMAILVVLMGFLFQFVIGAQEIWSASRKVSGLYDKAQNAMRWLEDDLHASICQSATRYPGRAYPFLIVKNGNQLKSISMVLARKNVTNMDDGLEHYVLPVKYEIKEDNKGCRCLYRMELSNLEFNPEPMEFASPNTPGDPDANLMLEGIDSFLLTTPQDVLNEKPRVVKIEMTLYDPKVVQKARDTANTQAEEDLLDKHSRVFSKIIFLDR